jgi:hypothetical protein
LIAGRDTGIMMSTKKQAGGIQKLVGTKKTAEELAFEEYQGQLELAIENR